MCGIGRAGVCSFEIGLDSARDDACFFSDLIVCEAVFVGLGQTNVGRWTRRAKGHGTKALGLVQCAA